MKPTLVPLIDRSIEPAPDDDFDSPKPGNANSTQLIYRPRTRAPPKTQTLVARNQSNTQTLLEELEAFYRPATFSSGRSLVKRCIIICAILAVTRVVHAVVRGVRLIRRGIRAARRIYRHVRRGIRRIRHFAHRVRGFVDKVRTGWRKVKGAYQRIRGKVEDAYNTAKGYYDKAKGVYEKGKGYYDKAKGVYNEAKEDIEAARDGDYSKLGRSGCKARKWFRQREGLHDGDEKLSQRVTGWCKKGDDEAKLGGAGGGDEQGGEGGEAQGEGGEAQGGQGGEAQGGQGGEEQPQPSGDVISTINQVANELGSQISANADLIKENYEAIQKNGEAIRENGIAIAKNYDEIRRTQELVNRNSAKLDMNLAEIQKNSKLINRNYDAIQQFEEKVSEKFERTFSHFEAVEKELQEVLRVIESSKVEIIDSVKVAQKEILDSVARARRAPIISHLTAFFNHFTTSCKALGTGTFAERINKLTSPLDIMAFLEGSRVPFSGTLHSNLMDILHQKLAIPASSKDLEAFSMMEMLAFGTKVYASIVFFLIQQYTILANYYTKKADVVGYNRNYLRLFKTFKDFYVTLVNRGGFFDKVTALFREVKALPFLDEDDSPLKEKDAKLFCSESIRIIRLISESLVNTGKTLTLEIPEALKVTLDFSTKASVPTPIADWRDGRKVQYAIQYFSKGGNNTGSGVPSMVSDWSRPYTITGRGCPVLKNIPVDLRNRTRVLYRRFDGGQPKIAAILTNSGIDEYCDVSRDLFDAAGEPNLAVSQNNSAIFLKTGKVDVNAVFDEEKRAIHLAAENQNLDLIKKLVERKVSLDVQDISGYSPLYSATASGNRKLVQFLLEKGANVNLKSSNATLGLAPLHVATYKGFTNITTDLLAEPKIDVNLQAADGSTALHFAVSFNQTMILHKLLANPKVNVNPMLGKNNFTLLHLAAVNNRTEAVKILVNSNRLEKEAINARAVDGSTPLHLAVLFKRNEMVDYLIGHGASIDFKTVNDTLPLHYAAMKGSGSMIRRLIGPFVNAVPRNDESPLYVALKFNNTQAIEVIDGNCGKLHQRFRFNRTMLHVAAIEGKMKLASRLIKAGLDVEASDAHGYRPVHYAVSNGHTAMVKFFISVDANFWKPAYSQAVLSGLVPGRFESALQLAVAIPDEDAALEMAKLVLQYRHGRGHAYFLRLDEEMATRKAIQAGHLDVVKLLRPPASTSLGSWGHNATCWSFDETSNPILDGIMSKNPSIVSYLHRTLGQPLNETIREDDPLCYDQLGHLGTKPGNATTVHFAVLTGDMGIISTVVETVGNSTAVVSHAKLAQSKDANSKIQNFKDFKKGNGTSVKKTSDKLPKTSPNNATMAAMVSAPDSNGKAPLELIMDLEKPTLPLIQLLVKNGATFRNSTVLLYKAIDCCAKIANWFLEKGIDVQSPVNEMLERPIHIAAQRGNLETIGKIVARAPGSLLELTKNGRSVLHYAIYGDASLMTIKWLIKKTKGQLTLDASLINEAASAGKLDVLQYLVSNVMNGTIDTSKGNPIRSAIDGAGQLAIVSYLVSKNVEVDYEDKTTNVTLIHAAIKANKTDIVHFLRGKVSGAPFLGTDDNGMHPIHSAAAQNNIPLVELALKNDATLADEDTKGKTPLWHAINGAGEMPMVKYLLDKKAKINDIKKKLNLVLTAMDNNKFDVARILAEAGADIRTPGAPVNAKEAGQLALFHAIASQNIPLLRVLMEKGARVDFASAIALDARTTFRGTHALEFAYKYNFEESLQFLVSGGAINMRAQTILHQAAGQYRTEYVRLLLDRGAQVNVKDAQKATPLHVAAQNGRLDAVKLLVEQKCIHLTAKNVRGQTALDVARENNKPDVVKFLAPKINSENQTPVPKILQGPKPGFTPKPQPTINTIDVQPTLLLLNVFIRKITKVRFIPGEASPPNDAPGYALKIVDHVETVLTEMARTSKVSLNAYNSFAFYQTVEKALISGKQQKVKDEIEKFMKSAFPVMLLKNRQFKGNLTANIAKLTTEMSNDHSAESLRGSGRDAFQANGVGGNINDSALRSRVNLLN